jgi:hypothetical protein
MPVHRRKQNNEWDDQFGETSTEEGWDVGIIDPYNVPDKSEEPYGTLGDRTPVGADITPQFTEWPSDRIDPIRGALSESAGEYTPPLYDDPEQDLALDPIGPDDADATQDEVIDQAETGRQEGTWAGMSITDWLSLGPERGPWEEGPGSGRQPLLAGFEDALQDNDFRGWWYSQLQQGTPLGRWDMHAFYSDPNLQARMLQNFEKFKGGTEPPPQTTPPPPSTETGGLYDLSESDIAALRGITDVTEGPQRASFMDVARRYGTGQAAFDEFMADAQAAGLPWSTVGSSGSIDFGRMPEDARGQRELYGNRGSQIVDVMQGYNDPNGGVWQWELDAPQWRDPATATAATAITDPATATESTAATAATAATDPSATAATAATDPNQQQGTLRRRQQQDVISPGFGETAPTRAPFIPPAYAEYSSTQVGTDPLSERATGALGTLLSTGGVAPTPLAADIEKTLQDILQSGGRVPALDARRDQDRALAVEAARSPLDVMRRAQIAQGGAALAGRGLLGSGAAREYGERLEERLAPQYTAAGQQIEMRERDREETRLSNAMTLASGMSQEQSRNLLNTVRTMSERTQMLSDIALRSLDQNMYWNKFLAEFGLQRAEVLERLSQGRLDSLLGMLQQYMGVTARAAQGFTYSD